MPGSKHFNDRITVLCVTLLGSGVNVVTDRCITFNIHVPPSALYNPVTDNQLRIIQYHFSTHKLTDMCQLLQPWAGCVPHLWKNRARVTM